MTTPEPIAYLLLKTDTAPKLGQHAAGGITYRILADTGRQELFLTITGNIGGTGYYSREIAPFAAVERCRPDDDTLSFPAKTFARSFVSRSSNNPGFLTAILRHEGLLGPVPEKVHQHLLTGNWPAWVEAQLALPGEPYIPDALAGNNATTLETQDAGAEAASSVDLPATPEAADDDTSQVKSSRKDKRRKA